VSLLGGTPPDGGSPKPSVSTGTREHGTPTQGMVTTGASNSFWLRGPVWVDGRDLTKPPCVSSFIVRGSCTSVMGSLGESGGQQGSAA